MVPTAARFRLFIICLLLFEFCFAYPSPYSRTSTVFQRLEETRLTSPVTVTTTRKITTDVGTFTQTCTITLTPIVVGGTDVVREEKSCVVTPDDGSSSALTLSGTSTSSSDSFSSTSDVVPPSNTNTPPPTGGIPLSTTDGLSIVSPPLSTDVPSNTVLPDSTVNSSPPASSGSVPPPADTLTSAPLPDVTSSMSSPPSSTSTSSVVESSSDVPVVVIGVSSVPNPTATPQPDSTGPSPDTSPPSSTVPLPLSQLSSTSSPTVSPTASAENAGAAATPFNPPGKKLEVLPIGLGVFAGVSVIALIVVGIVTYERTKHRRNFRKLREQEANRMGYGTT